MNSSALTEHLLISIISWFIGTIFGGGLGYACALLGRHLLATSTSSGKRATLWPWRTIVISLPLLWPFVPTLAGLGTWAGVVMVGSFVFALALVFTVTTLFDYWFTPSLTTRFIAGARTLAVASPILAAAASILGGGGVGSLMWQGGPDYSALATIVLLAFLFDMVLGLLQMAVSQSGRLSPGAQAA